MNDLSENLRMRDLTFLNSKETIRLYFLFLLNSIFFEQEMPRALLHAVDRSCAACTSLAIKVIASREKYTYAEILSLIQQPI